MSLFSSPWILAFSLFSYLIGIGATFFWWRRGYPSVSFEKKSALKKQGSGIEDSLAIHRTPVIQYARKETIYALPLKTAHSLRFIKKPTLGFLDTILTLYPKRNLGDETFNKSIYTESDDSFILNMVKNAPDLREHLIALFKLEPESSIQCSDGVLRWIIPGSAPLKVRTEEDDPKHPRHAHFLHVHRVLEDRLLVDSRPVSELYINKGLWKNRLLLLSPLFFMLPVLHPYLPPHDVFHLRFHLAQLMPFFCLWILFLAAIRLALGGSVYTAATFMRICVLSLFLGLPSFHLINRWANETFIRDVHSLYAVMELEDPDPETGLQPFKAKMDKMIHIEPDRNFFRIELTPDSMHLFGGHREVPVMVTYGIGVDDDPIILSIQKDKNPKWSASPK